MDAAATYEENRRNSSKGHNLEVGHDIGANNENADIQQ